MTKGEGPLIRIDLETTYSYAGMWLQVEIRANDQGNHTTLHSLNHLAMNPTNTITGLCLLTKYTLVEQLSLRQQPRSLRRCMLIKIKKHM